MKDRGDVITGFEIQLDGGNVDFAELHLGFMYGAQKISNLEDWRKNERNHSKDTVTGTIDPAARWHTLGIVLIFASQISVYHLDILDERLFSAKH